MISVCLAVSVRELRTAVREWAASVIKLVWSEVEKMQQT